MKIRSGLVLILMIALLCACEKSPSSDVIISKNDGAFDVNAAVSDAEDHLPNSTEDVSFTDTFYSTDGTVKFIVSIEETVPDANMPIVEVTPHSISEEDARMVAETLFGTESLFYEAEPMFDAMYSQGEIAEQIARWSPYSSVSALKELLGDKDESELELNAEIIKEHIEYLTTEEYEQAPHDYMRNICRWEYRKSSYYVNRSKGKNQKDLREENDEIHAWTLVEDYFYTFEVSKRNASDFNLNNIYAYPNTSGPICLDYEICRSKKLRTAEPTNDQITTAANNAQQMLDAMGLGTWLVDRKYVIVNDKGTSIEYSIYVDAVPVFNDVPAVRRPQLTNLKSTETFASNYYLTDAHFEFSANGDLVDFSLYSPVDIRQIVNPNVATLSMQELMLRAKQHLSMSDYYEYGLGNVVDEIQEEVECCVNIDKVDYGLTRVRVPDSDESYYYVPAIILYGSVEYLGRETGAIYYQSNRGTGELATILMLNAVDGTVVLGN